MIQQLKLSKFQTYKKAKIDFADGLNVLIGPTDAGKSRIVKSLKWTATNKPRVIKVAPRSDPKALTISSIKVDGNIIKRIKGKGRNEYILIDKDKNKKVFKSFKSKVPDEIKSILNISSLNFQNQHDAPFLLSISSGARARYLNKTIDLEIIDRSQKNISKRIQKEYNKLSKQKQEVINLKRQIKEYDWLPNAEVKLKRIENGNRKINHIENQIDEVSNILKIVKQNKKQIKKLKKITNYKKEVDNLIITEKEMGKEEDEIEDFKLLVKNTIENKRSIRIYKTKKEELQKRFDKLMKNRCPLCKRKIKNA